MTDVVLVHGAWAGGWVWDTVTGPLRAAGLRPHVVELPGVGVEGVVDDGEVVDLGILTDHVCALVRRLERPAVLVGHSGGGVVVTQVAERMPDRVAGVAFVAGMMLPSGMDFAALCAGLGLRADVGISRWLEPGAGGRVTAVPPEAAAAVFFHDAPAGEAIAASRRLRPQQESARLIAPRWTVDRFGRVPRLYIEATWDRTVPIVAQRRMQQLTPGARVVTLHTGHAPQLSAQGLLSAAIADFAIAVAASPAGPDAPLAATPTVDPDLALTQAGGAS
ncbi:alpha/beta fold hydrolase [Dietzia sp. B32]|uniref:alpha/beta fold hydrolase n=1 Tax=Dietzia sp. B32 TaxID=2915130 RepID=UPI0021AE262F|nr:alpha/beta fold hydrolase [Dietzia sp. B32]UVE96502.1 alpha/beta fold hydrolase [Dietzia sp. B32]